MFRTLVVPLDGSLLAERALPYAVRLAQVGRGRLILMRAALAAPPVSLEGTNWERDQLAAVDEAEAYLRQVADGLARQVPVEVSAPYGHAAHEILETAARFEADGIVIATHGRTGFAHLLYGSVTESVLANSMVPVFTVYARPGQAPAPPFSPFSARVLVPQDGSPYDAPAVNTAVSILGLRGEITLVTVVPPAEQVERDEFGRVLAYLDQQMEARQYEARDYLNGIADELRGRPLPISVNVDVRVGDPASGITLAAIDSVADLIVMSTHGRTGIRRAVLGSVAGTVLRTGDTPVLLVHPQTPAVPAPTPKRRILVHA
jgi:nucleotide-binding universal stress UspA family protein